jgi:hypothetical protein
MAAGRTADPSASLGMTRGEVRLRLEWLVDERNSRSLHCAPPDFLFRVWTLMKERAAF